MGTSFEEIVGGKALGLALSLWEMGIIDPKRGATSPVSVDSRNHIQAFIREGLEWGDTYTGDGDFEWCGAFAAYCWAFVGLKSLWRKDFWASTYRLNAYGSYRPLVFPKRTVANPKPDLVKFPFHSTRLYQDLNNIDTTKSHTLYKPLPGDILLVGDKRGYGTHITMVESFSPKTGVFKTVSGNGVGMLGANFGRGQGVVKKNYTLGKGPRVLIRPSASDITPDFPAPVTPT